jgi:mRNA-degrading endonuclease RelE of RelBE toxin-antitoxin system
MTKITLRPRALDGIEKASKEGRLKIKFLIETLRKGLFPLHTKKLGGYRNGYSTRIGQWRILFVLDNGEIDIADIFIKKGKDDYRRRL